jgi:hypothetical protein
MWNVRVNVIREREERVGRCDRGKIKAKRMKSSCSFQREESRFVGDVIMNEEIMSVLRL